MFKDLNINANNNISYDDTRIKSSHNSPSFRATNPNAVDTTPTADTYTPQAAQAPQEQPVPYTPPGQQPEMDMGTKFLRYGIPTGAALYVASELFDKANAGDYEKSLVGRLGAFGDKVSQNPTFGKYASKMAKKGGSLKSKLLNFINSHDKTRAMYQTPTAPECTMVTSFLETQADHDLSRGMKKLNKEFLQKNPKTLLSAGATEVEIEALKGKYGVNALGRIKNQKAAVQEFMFNKLGGELGYHDILTRLETNKQAMDAHIQALEARLNDPSVDKKLLKKRIKELENLRDSHEQRVLTALKRKYVGLKRSDIGTIEKDVASNAAKIENALAKGAKFSPSVSAAYNQVKSATKPVTRLGRFLPKMAKLGMRGLTFGGGFWNCLLFLGFFLGEAVKNTIDAPKDKKVSTGVHGFFDAISWVVAMPLAVKAMHAVNGLKNLGNSKADVERVNNARKAFNNKVKSGVFTGDRAAYDAGRAELDAVKATLKKPKGFVNKALSKVAKFLSISLGQTESYREATAPMGKYGKNILNVLKPSNLKKVGGNILRKLPNFGRNCVGYPLRFALYMFAFQPIVDKLFTTPLNAIFGKPYDPEKIKEEQAKKAEEAAKLAPPPAISPNPEAVVGLENIDFDSLSDDNLVKRKLIEAGAIKPSGNRGNQPGMPGAQPNQYPMNNDPEKSEYDTVPLTYTPQIDYNNPVPYHDPQDPTVNPDYAKNYNEAQKQYDKTEKMIADVEAFIKERK